MSSSGFVPYCFSEAPWLPKKLRHLLPPDIPAVILLEPHGTLTAKAITIHIHPDSVTALQLHPRDRMVLGTWIARPSQSEDDQKRIGKFALRRPREHEDRGATVHFTGRGAGWWRRIVDTMSLQLALGESTLSQVEQELANNYYVALVPKASIESTDEGKLLVFDPRSSLTVVGVYKRLVGLITGHRSERIKVETSDDVTPTTSACQQLEPSDEADPLVPADVESDESPQVENGPGKESILFSTTDATVMENIEDGSRVECDETVSLKDVDTPPTEEESTPVEADVDPNNLREKALM